MLYYSSARIPQKIGERKPHASIGSSTGQSSKRDFAGSRILVVDDDAEIVELLRYNLEKAGYEVLEAMSGLQALKIIRKNRPALILLDIMMPGMDGIQLCKFIQQQGDYKDIPILMLTAKTAESTEIEAIQSGADDYLRKPISTRLLISRIEALLRRRQKIEESGAPSGRISIAGLVIDTESHTISYRNEDITLTPKEFLLLAFLASNPGKVFSRDHLLEHIWGKAVVVIPRTVDVHIRRIRMKTDDSIIETVKGVGYRFQQS